MIFDIQFLAYFPRPDVLIKKVLIRHKESACDHDVAAVHPNQFIYNELYVAACFKKFQHELELACFKKNKDFKSI